MSNQQLNSYQMFRRDQKRALKYLFLVFFVAIPLITYLFYLLNVAVGMDK